MTNENNVSSVETDSASVLSPDPLRQNGEKRRRHHESRPLKIRRVSMRHGWYWLIEGFMLWARAPAFLSFLTLCFVLISLVSIITPLVGELLASILMPGLILGVFNGCRAIDRKRKLSPSLLISGFRRHAFDLLLAGFFNFIIMTFVVLVSQLFDDGMTWHTSSMYVSEQKAQEMVNVSFTSLPFLSFPFLVTMVLSAVWLFVPQLIGWWRLSVPKALLFSLKGCLINWLPFLTYGFCFGFFIIVLSALVINFFQFAASGLGTVVCAVFLLIIVPALIASFYVAARDIYGFPRRRKHRKRRPDPAQDEGKAPDEGKKRRRQAKT